MTDEPAADLTPAQAASQAIQGASDLQAAMPGKRKYPSPSSYKGTEWAVGINAMLDGLDAPGDDALFHDPASKFMVGECAMATAATMTDADLNIHPGYLLCFSLVAYAAVVAVHRFAPKQGQGEAPAPAEGNRFANLA